MDTLIGIWAHPDDETYLSAALMRRVVGNGGRVVVVSATRGEAGSDDPEVDRAALGRRREAELRRAMAALGVTEIHVLGLPDGGCAEVPADEPVARLRTLLEAERPDVVVTFGPDGITHHPDHVAVGRWATRAWMETTGDRRASRLLYATLTDGFVRRHRRDFAEVPLTLSGEPHPIADEDVALRVEPTPAERRRKRAALSAHRSQLAPLVALLGERRLHDWFVDETFRDPTPAELAAAGAAGPVLATGA